MVSFVAALRSAACTVDQQNPNTLAMEQYQSRRIMCCTLALAYCGGSANADPDGLVRPGPSGPTLNSSPHRPDLLRAQLPPAGLTNEISGLPSRAPRPRPHRIYLPRHPAGAAGGGAGHYRTLCKTAKAARFIPEPRGVLVNNTATHIPGVAHNRAGRCCRRLCMTDTGQSTIRHALMVRWNRPCGVVRRSHHQ
ncbi:hypothetical protein LPJGGPFB_04859 [Ensifer adhaerens]|nr:hypothetical protein [Ensifer adhaerens]